MVIDYVTAVAFMLLGAGGALGVYGIVKSDRGVAILGVLLVFAVVVISNVVSMTT